MTEAWVAKRWDLRGYVDRMEMEKAVIDLVSNGLLREKASSGGPDRMELEGKSALFVNAGTVLGKAISSSLLSIRGETGCSGHGRAWGESWILYARPGEMERGQDLYLQRSRPHVS